MLTLPTTRRTCKECLTDWFGSKNCPNCGSSNTHRWTEEEKKNEAINTLINMGMSNEKATKRYDKLKGE